MESLREQVVKLHQEMKTKEQRNILAIERMKKQLEESNKKNEELLKESKLMEKLRVKNIPTYTNIHKSKIKNKISGNINTIPVKNNTNSSNNS